MSTRKLFLFTLMLAAATLLSLPVQSASGTTEFCTTCEAQCYAHAENVSDYNACILLCNYAGCNLPMIPVRDN
jgi:hypothetical protein